MLSHYTFNRLRPRRARTTVPPTFGGARPSLPRHRSSPRAEDSIPLAGLDTDSVMNQIRLFLVDDERTVRQGLRMRLGMEPDFTIVGEAADGRSAVESATEVCPDVVLMDIHIPILDGIQATAALRDAVPGCAVVMLSMQDDTDTRARARAAGAAGFVAKHQMETALAEAIRSAASRTGTPNGGSA